MKTKLYWLILCGTFVINGCKKDEVTTPLNGNISQQPVKHNMVDSLIPDPRDKYTGVFFGTYKHGYRFLIDYGNGPIGVDPRLNTFDSAEVIAEVTKHVGNRESLTLIISKIRTQSGLVTIEYFRSIGIIIPEFAPKPPKKSQYFTQLTQIIEPTRIYWDYQGGVDARSDFLRCEIYNLHRTSSSDTLPNGFSIPLPIAQSKPMVNSWK